MSARATRSVSAGHVLSDPPWQAFDTTSRVGFFAHMWNGESLEASNNGGKYLGLHDIYPA